MNEYLIALILSTIFLILTLIYVLRKKNNQLVKIFSISVVLMIIWCLGLVAQILFSSRFNIKPIYFDYFVYIGICFLPVAIFFLGFIYENTNIKFKRIYYLFFIVPVISLFGLWTNDWHHLFFKKHSINMDEVVIGPFLLINSIYLYLLIGLGLFKLLKFNIKNSGFFSKQSFLIILGILVPVIANILGTLKLIPMTIYVTPICFTFSIIVFAIAIFKFNFLEASPIAFQKIVNIISDSYLILNDYNVVTDFNQNLLRVFKCSEQEIRGKQFRSFLKKVNKEDKFDILKNNIIESKASHKTLIIENEFKKIDKIFSIEITALYLKEKFICTVVLFKDITEHVRNLKQIEENQYIMQRQAQFAILGEFAGGLAHDLNSPLSAVQLDMATLQKYIKSDKISAEPQIKEVIFEMMDNINSSLNKMNKIICGVRNQIRATGNTESEEFNIREIVDGIEILFGSLLRKNNCVVENLIDKNINIYGEKNKLDRVIGNVIKNSIDAYVQNNKRGKITIFSNIIDNNCIIGIQDEAGGIPEDIAQTMFKEMKTTKAESGTGFGLYYSNTIIESSFKGTMSFETEKGKGTIFYISIPMVKEEV